MASVILHHTDDLSIKEDNVLKDQVKHGYDNACSGFGQTSSFPSVMIFSDFFI